MHTWPRSNLEKFSKSAERAIFTITVIGANIIKSVNIILFSYLDSETGAGSCQHNN